MLTIRDSRPGDGARAIAIWRSAVDATHDFLSPAHREEIDELVCSFLPETPLVLAVDESGVAIGFMILTGACMEGLFIHADHRGKGVGRALVEHALALHPAITTEVNEQNGQAVGFYERMGFERTGRSATDDAGRPYPLLHLAIGSPTDQEAA